MNNNPNTNLNDFLNKNKQSLEDDFEKDAFAGFESISSKDEAFDIKATLDKKINTQLFSEKKRYFDGFSSHNKTVWYAAASLMLVIGLSVLFILNTNDSIVKSKNISMVDTKQNEANDQEKVADIIEQTPTTKEVKPEEKSTVVLGEAEKTKTVSDKNTLQSNKSYAADIQPGNTSKKADANNADLAKNNGAGGKTTGYTSTATTAETDDESNTKAPVTLSTTDTRKNEPKKGEGIASEVQTITSANATSYNYPATKAKEEKDASTGSATEKKDSKEKVSKRSAVKKQRAEQNQQPSATATEVANGPTVEDKNLEREKNNFDLKSKDEETAKPKTVSATSGANQCYYSGGETVLQTDVAQKLIAKNVNYPFIATLFINEKKQVQKVNFTKDDNLTKADKKTIENELKTLTKFDFFISPTTKTLFEFKLDYKP